MPAWAVTGAQPVAQTFVPAMLQGLTVHPENPLAFDFIVHSGDKNLQGANFRKESETLIKYFLAALTVPEDQMWVNLNPAEPDRIIPKGFAGARFDAEKIGK